ncbi:hypothetical protein GALL_441770 [mine drainage metagenome]|uniref:Uncharacterized protein n=1 Tax=mine drainage metagenome TaxID=410659 RepID=A0A1J5QDY9_9ZZZZ
MKPIGQALGDKQSLVAERREGSGGAAELQAYGFAAQPLQPDARTVQGRGIFRELEAERHRQRVLQPGARHDRGVAVLLREPGKAGNCAVDIREQHVDARAKGEHGSGVDHVLAGGAPVHIARRVRISLGDVRGQRLDEGNCEVAGPPGGVGQGGKVEAIRLAGTSDRAGRACRNDARCGFRARQGRFKIKHLLEACHIVADGAHGGARQHGREQGGERGTHDGRDLTIPAGLCQSQSVFGKPAAPRICIALRPFIPFLLGWPCFTWGK